MEKRIELECGGRPIKEVVELNLDNCRSTSIDGLTDEYHNLQTLSLINSGLTTLKGIPALVNLQKLELSDNKLVDGLEYLTKSPNITHLSLSGNKIKDVDTLQHLAKLKKLKCLDLYNCEVTNEQDYRSKVFQLIPHLKYLDGTDVSGAEDVEDESEDEEGDEEDNEYLDDSDIEEEGENEELGDGTDENKGDDDDEDDEDIDPEMNEVDEDDEGKGGNDQDVEDLDDEDEDEDDSEDDDSEDDDGPGLAYLGQDDLLSDEDDDEEYVPGPDPTDDDGDMDESMEEDASKVKGVKRKHDTDNESTDKAKISNKGVASN